ncbi:hypothetical protein QCBJ_01590 [Pseudomonas sp. QC2]|uniref:hypothetical protein n=1 Tax=Pseudomonas sp. QC2 TaxID=2065822 RepID=UPI000C7CBE25|nr:hypothetical protein [Pseudomonas sp. QC2]PLR64779.1 hypothetical protein QCBJ_01590 [Pseudomonas sp. QC2]
MKLPTVVLEHFDNLTEINEAQSLRILEGDFSGDVRSDLITQCFLDDDPILFEKAIPWLKDAVQQAGFIDIILRLERHRLKFELARFDPIYDHSAIELIETKLEELCASTLREDALRCFADLCSILVAAKDFSARQCGENYYFTKLLRTLYEDHLTEQREQSRFIRTPQKDTLLYQFYKAADVDLLESDTQYSKYNLYSITADTELLIGLPSRILDLQRQVQLFINTPKHILELFERLRKDGLIEDLALLTSDHSFLQTDKRYFVSFGIEYIWQPLTLDNVVHQPIGAVARTILRTCDISAEGTALQPSVSTFYAQGSGDKIWCSITANSMTFEEVAQVPELLEDCAVTQLIHLEYFVEDGRLHVSHIDHEYIFYTLEEFDLRGTDPSQKGNARKRLKTFKIDRSAIPFVLDDGTLFVHTLIDACFDKPYLLTDFLLGLLQPRG